MKLKSATKGKKVRKIISSGGLIKSNDIFYLTPEKDEDFLLEVVVSKKPLKLVKSAVGQLDSDFMKQERVLMMVADIDNGYLPESRKKALRKLSPSKHPDVFMKVILKESNYSVRVTAVNQVKDPFSKLLEEALEDEDPYVRGMAIEKISRISFYDLLRDKAVNDPHPYVRLSALLKIKKESNIDVFKKALKDPDEGIKQLAQRVVKNHSLVTP